MFSRMTTLYCLPFLNRGSGWSGNGWCITHRRVDILGTAQRPVPKAVQTSPEAPLRTWFHAWHENIQNHKTDQIREETIYALCSKKLDRQTHGGNCPVLTDFQNAFTVKILPHLKRDDILPCEICLQEIVMLKNDMNKLPCMQDSATENCCQNTHLMMWALCNSLTRRYLPSNSQNNSLYAPAATKKKDSTAKSFRTSSTFNHSL